MHIDCDTCEVRGRDCGDCVVTFLLGSAPEGVVLDADERAALGVLADSGLVPPLRLLVPLGHPKSGGRNGMRTNGDSMKSAG